MAVCVGAHSDFPFVLMHNRDEFFARATTSLELHETGLLCATDEASGGTWMGINVNTGQVAALTNVRCAPVDGCRSRGELVSRVLHGDVQALDSDMFANYNLLHCTLGTDLPEVRLSTSMPIVGQQFTTSLHEDASVSGLMRSSGIVATKSNDASGTWTHASALPNDQGTWPKAAWLRGEAEALIASTDIQQETGEAGARVLLGALAPLLSATSLPAPFADHAARWVSAPPGNTLPVEVERCLQKAPFIEPMDLPLEGAPIAADGRGLDHSYGTVSQSVIIQCRSEGCVFYAYRKTHGVVGCSVGRDSLEWVWRRVDVPHLGPCRKVQ